MKIKLAIVSLLLCLAHDAKAYTPNSCWMSVTPALTDNAFVTFNTGYSQHLDNGIEYEYPISNIVTIAVSNDINGVSIRGLPRVVFASYHADLLGFPHRDSACMEHLPTGCRVMSCYGYNLCLNMDSSARSVKLTTICTNPPATSPRRPDFGTNFHLSSYWQYGSDFGASSDDNEVDVIHIQAFQPDQEGNENDYEGWLWPGQLEDTCLDDSNPIYVRARYEDMFGEPVSDWSDIVYFYP